MLLKKDKMSGLGKMYLPKGPALETARKVLEMNAPMD